MAWPTAAEIGVMTRVTVTDGATSYDYNVTGMITEVIADLASKCLRPLGFDQQTVTETFDGGNHILSVTCPPIISVTSVTDNEDEETLDPDEDEYYVYEKYIRLPRATQTTRVALRDRTPQRYTVIYVGGYTASGTPVPAILRDICAEIASRILLRVDQQYREYQNVDKFQDGEIQSVFPDKEKAFEDQYRKLSSSGHILRSVR